MDCSPPGSSVHGISQPGILEWVAISFFRGPSRPRDQTRVSCTGRRPVHHWATLEALCHVSQDIKGEDASFRSCWWRLINTKMTPNRQSSKLRTQCPEGQIYSDGIQLWLQNQYGSNGETFYQKNWPALFRMMKDKGWGTVCDLKTQKEVDSAGRILDCILNHEKLSSLFAINGMMGW